MGEMVPSTNTEFFQLMKEHPDVVDYRAMRSARRHKFSTYFKLLFQPVGSTRTKNMQSWLAAIASHFRIHMDYVKPFMRDEALELFQEFNLDPSDIRNSAVFQFWIYLNKIYISLLYQGYTGRDNIFGFMTGFPIHETKVVIVGQDPTRSFDSSGFAFHLSPCVSTAMLIKFVSEELDLVSQVCEGDCLQLSKYQWERTHKSGELNGWIQQGVLMINSCLTSKKANWNVLVNYLIRYLSQNMENLVFILAGNMAIEKSRFVDYKKHLVLRVYHPASYAYKKRQSRQQNGRDWDRVLPFINANFFLLQKQNMDPSCLIDWHQLAGKGKKQDRDDRLANLRAFYLKVLQDKNTVNLEPGAKYVYCPYTISRAEGFKETYDIRVTRGKGGIVYLGAFKAKQ